MMWDVSVSGNDTSGIDGESVGRTTGNSFGVIFAAILILIIFVEQ